MPHVDFGQAFSSPDDNKPPATATLAAGTFSKPTAEAFDPAPRPSWLTKSGWSNVSFVVTAVFGGLFFAFYLFSDTELFRTARRWSREFLYAQPQTPDVAREKVAQAIGVEPPRAPAKTGDNSGDPFSRANSPLSSFNPPHTGNGRVNANPLVISGGVPAAISPVPGIPGVPSVPGLPRGPRMLDPSGLLLQLNVPVPGGDHLTKAFNRAVAELQRVSQLVDKRTVVVVETKVTKIAKVTHNSTRGTAGNNRENGLSDARQTAAQDLQTTSGTTGNALNSTTSHVSNTTSNVTGNTVAQTTTNAGNAINSTFGNVRGAVSNPGGLGMGGGHGGGGHR